MIRNERGSTLVFALAIMGLLMLLVGLLYAPAHFEADRLDQHYHRVRAGYLSLAGVECARAWAGAGIVTNATYGLGEGTVTVTMTRETDKNCLVQSAGRIDNAATKKPTEVRTEVTVQLP